MHDYREDDNPGLNHRVELDVLRGLAILLVLINHLRLPHF